MLLDIARKTGLTRLYHFHRVKVKRRIDVLREHIPALKDAYHTYLLEKQNLKHDFYAPRYMPWRADQNFVSLYRTIKSKTLISDSNLYALYSLAKQAINIDGNFYECGVYKGGSSYVLANILRMSKTDKKLKLFDTYDGMPEGDEIDWHKKGDLADTEINKVMELVGNDLFIEYIKGFLPDTFSSDGNIALAHVDVDLYSSVLACCKWLYPRMTAGGFMVFDDYGYPTTLGAKKAVDEFFADKPEFPLILASGSAVIIKI